VSLRTRAARFARLPAAQRRVLLQALWLFAVQGPGLRALGLRRLQRAFPVAVSPREGLPAAQVARLVHAAARHGPLRPGCLTISVTLQRILGWHGAACDLRFGVRKLGHGLEAHAWIERCGEVLLDVRDPGARFAAFEGVIGSSPEARR
jgi:hypothetical protein